jgi:hypothetical protein
MPAERRRQGEAVVAYLVHAGALHALIALLVSLLILDCSWQQLRARVQANRAEGGDAKRGSGGAGTQAGAGAQQGRTRQGGSSGGGGDPGKSFLFKATPRSGRGARSSAGRGGGAVQRVK